MDKYRIMSISKLIHHVLGYDELLQRNPTAFIPHIGNEVDLG